VGGTWRRLASSGALALVAVALGAGVAFADNGPHVAGAGATPDTCASCHRAHTAAGPNLIREATPEALCLSCHGSSAVGATTNVSDGTLAGAATPTGLLGGGFTNTLMNTSWTASPTAVYATTSSHMTDGVTSGTMWGNGAISSSPDAGKTGVTMTCTSCHDPHGNGSYRILRPIPNGSGAAADVVVTEQATKVYTVTSDQNRYFGEYYSELGYYDAGGSYSLTRWCSQCHTRYDAYNPGSYTNGPGHTDSGDAIFKYRHLTRYDSDINCGTCHPGGYNYPMINADDPLGVGSQIAMEGVCENCHVAHGTSALMGGYAANVAWPDNAVAPSGNGRSSLLRMDNRGICRGCHGK
jgi:predicted CXXCH cytochrome family protein